MTWITSGNNGARGGGGAGVGGSDGGGGGNKGLKSYLENKNDICIKISREMKRFVIT